jgi:hypothetical protein
MVHQLWYALPLIVVFSLVYAGTRHEQMQPILQHALRLALWVTGFMVLAMGLILLLTWWL